ncbi:EF-hand domain-containing protein [Thiohalorhabdus sp. Cl-TMA]|uniref:EF-hand domain-containing protein n=1 Tax=Thiohalorhabdus methylotrophus TaxID=3242694 RepID=A0ABV4U179_9GAMM
MQRKTKLGMALGVTLVAGTLLASGVVLAGGSCKGGGPGRGPDPLERFDTNGDGKLTTEELRDFRTERLHKFDKNGDGHLGLDEFEGAWLAGMETRMVRRFQHFDRDGSGEVTEEEYLRPVTRMMRHLDRDGDGTVTREELRKMHRYHGGPRRGHH